MSNLNSSSSEFGKLLDSITGGLFSAPGVYARVPKDASQFICAIRMLLLNLLYVRFSDPDRYVAIPVGASAYRRTKDGFGYKAFRRAFQSICQAGLCEHQPGFRDRTTGKGRVTRIRATVRLMELAAEHHVRPSSISAPSRKQLVELRGPKQAALNARERRKVVPPRLEWPSDKADQEARDEMVANLKRVNEHLDSCFVGLHVSDETVQEINRELFAQHDRDGEWERPEITWVNFYRKRLHRVFSDGSTKRGGRFYGAWWEGIPKRHRKHIHLAKPGEVPCWTMELDFGSTHPTLLYAREGRMPPWDCYAIDERFITGDGRTYAKNAMLMLLNASSRDAAERALRNEVRKEFDRDWYLRNGSGERRPPMQIADMIPRGCPSIREMLDLLAEYHRPIRRYFCTGVANELMYFDSQIAEHVMLKLLEQGISSLPVHDSFIVRHEHERALEVAMRQAFRDVVGREPQRIERSQTELKDFEDRNGGEWCSLGSHDYLAELNVEGRTANSIYWTHRRDWEGTKTGPPTESQGERRTGTLGPAYEEEPVAQDNAAWEYA